MQSPNSIFYDRSNVAESDPGAAEFSLLHVSSPAPQEAGVALEARSPNADPTERLPVYPRAPRKMPASERPGRLARFARETPKTAATLLILVLAVLRPFLRLVAFDRAFSRPPIAELSLYVLILALLIVVF